MDPELHIALYEPEIPQNTGNIGRLCLGLGARLHVIHPIGFRMDEKAVRRAGLDYWKYVDLQEHANFDDFIKWAKNRRIFSLTTKGDTSLWSVSFERGDVLLMGPETRGLPKAVRDQTKPCRIPMTGQIRSLNLSNATAVAAYHAMSQIKPLWF